MHHNVVLYLLLQCKWVVHYLVVSTYGSLSLISLQIVPIDTNVFVYL